tara:strand:+ start:753 stop:953 length:201 start_codon:yes stop_codon:yes gene_type:complete
MRKENVFILMSLIILFMAACSKEDPIIHTCRTCKGCSGKSGQMPAFDKKHFLDKWEKENVRGKLGQ